MAGSYENKMNVELDRADEERIRVRDQTACDMCAVTALGPYPGDVPASRVGCPGVNVHCERDEHCTTWDASCNASARVDDHPNECCHCRRAIE